MKTTKKLNRDLRSYRTAMVLACGAIPWLAIAFLAGAACSTSPSDRQSARSSHGTFILRSYGALDQDASSSQSQDASSAEPDAQEVDGSSADGGALDGSATTSAV